MAIEQVNRRNFNRLAAFAALCPPLLRAFNESFENPWKLGIITDQVNLDLAQTLRTFYPKFRLHWAEIRYLQIAAKKKYVYAEATLGELRLVRQQLDDAGVKLSVLDTAVYKIALPGTTPVVETPAYVDRAHGEFEMQLEDLKHAADAAHTLGAERIRIFTFLRVADPAASFDRVVEELQKAIVVAKQQDITLLVENEYDCNTGTGEETAKLFRTGN